MGYKEFSGGTSRESRAVSVQLTGLLVPSAGQAHSRCLVNIHRQERGKAPHLLPTGTATLSLSFP